MAGLFAGVLRAGIPVWTDTTLLRLDSDGDRVRGAVVTHGGREVTITARRGVVLATGGFDHSMDMRWKFQSESLGANQVWARRPTPATGSARPRNWAPTSV